MGRACGGPNEIGLTAIGVELNGSRGVPRHGLEVHDRGEVRVVRRDGHGLRASDDDSNPKAVTTRWCGSDEHHVLPATNPKAVAKRLHVHNVLLQTRENAGGRAHVITLFTQKHLLCSTPIFPLPTPSQT